jgi:hypothetical protein
MKLNDIFTFTMTATPIADLSDLKVAGDLSTKSVCANSTVSLNVHSHSELHFDVDWLHIHDDKTWDKDIYSSGNVCGPRREVSLQVFTEKNENEKFWCHCKKRKSLFSAFLLVIVSCTALQTNGAVKTSAAELRRCSSLST